MMKYNQILRGSLLLVLTAVLSGCVGDLRERVDSLEKELSGVKKEQAWARNEILTLKKLTEAQAKAISITEIQPLNDGYKLILSHGDPIVVKNGKDGAKGDKGEIPQLSIEEKDGMVIITYNDKTYMIPKRSKEPVPNILDNMAEYNVQSKTRTFETRHTTDGSVTMTHSQAKRLFSKITISGVVYHLPNAKEWQTICPLDDYYVRFDQNASYSDAETEGELYGRSLICKGDYKVITGPSESHGKTIALRFKNSAYISAWKYEYVDVDVHEPARGKCMKITCAMLSESETATLADLEQQTFWDAHSTNTVVRLLPCAGYKVGENGEVQRPKVYGCYWALDERLYGMQAYSFYFDEDYPNIAPNLKRENNIEGADYYRSCRLFKTRETPHQ